jgi:uncharacterized damage-inducible protein DinB
MNMMEYLHKLFAYNHWANRETLTALKATGHPPPRALKIMGHVIGAERLWLGRVQQEKTGAVWPELTLDQCDAQIADLQQLWQDYLKSLTPAKLAQPISYTNTKGESFTDAVQDILLHLVMHSAYHRGQVASELRGSGHTPAYTDFIHAVRSGFVK